MFCRNCGAELSEGATFCSNCGANLSHSAAGSGQTTADGSQTEAGKKKSKKKVIIVSLILLIIALAATGLLYVKNNLGKKAALIYSKNEKLYKWTGKESSKLPAELNGNAYGFRFLKSGLTLYYSGDNDLKLYDLNAEDSVKISSDVSNFWVDKEEGGMVWLGSDGKLNRRKLEMSAEKETIDTKVGEVRYISEDLNRIVYEKKGDIYVCMNSDEPQKVNGTKGNIYTMDIDGDIQIVWAEGGANEQVDLSLFVDDDKAEEDAEVKEPNIADYQHKEMKDSFWGMREATVTDDKYYEDLEKYEEVRGRNELRNTLKNAVRVGNVKYYSYSVKDDEKTELYDGPGNEIIAYNPNVVIYETFDLESIKKIKLSDLTGSDRDDIQNQMNQILNSTVRLTMYNGKTANPIDIETGDGAPNALIRLVDKDKSLVYFTMSDTTGSGEIPLYSADYVKNDGNVSVYSDDIDMAILAHKGEVFYMTDMEGNHGELYYGDERIASDVLVGSVRKTKDEEAVLFLEDGDSEGNGTLYYFTGKKTKISNDVRDYRVNDKGDIAYITDYSSKNNEGELKVYRNGKTVDVDDDVRSILYY